MSREQIEQPTKPLDVDGRAAMGIGTALWGVALLALLIGGRLAETGTGWFDESNGWWLWVCIAGFGIGVLGMIYTQRRAAVYRAHAEAGQ